MIALTTEGTDTNTINASEATDAATAYGNSAVSRRRRSAADLAALDDALFAIVEAQQPLGVRGLFYQAIAAGLCEKDETRGYRLVWRRTMAMREAGRIPWEWITDASRLVYGSRGYRSVSEFLVDVAGQYRKDYWTDSPVQVEVWIEKLGLAETVFPVVSECGLPLYISKGQSSVAYLHSAGEAIKADGRPAHVYVLSDLDDSGLWIAQSIEERLRAFASSVPVTVERLAVTREQVVSLRLPTRPPKDARRWAKRARTHGRRNVELDAIPPNELRRIVRAAIQRHMKVRALRVFQAIEADERQHIETLFGLSDEGES